jgi:phospholipase A1
MKIKLSSVLGLSALCLIIAAPASSAEDPELNLDAYNQCLLERMRTAADETPVSEIRQACLEESRGLATGETEAADATAEDEDAEQTPLAARIEETEATEEMRFVITPYKPNYIMVGYNPDGNTAPFEEAFPDEDIEFKTAEVKFQISFMFPIVQNIYRKNGDLYFAFTSRSFWQLFNEDFSAPFRETNYEPEFWFRFDTDWKLLGLTNRLVTFGYNHQSNGRNRPLSRSWNRLFANFVLERDNFALSIKPWVVIGDIDDNADITDFLGNYELHFFYKWNHHTFSLMTRNQLQSGFETGAYQFDWSFPIYRRLRFYTQYFNGYGESLIDYDYFNNTLGVGLSFTDYF